MDDITGFLKYTQIILEEAQIRYCLHGIDVLQEICPRVTHSIFKNIHIVLNRLITEQRKFIFKNSVFVFIILQHKPHRI